MVRRLYTNEGDEEVRHLLKQGAKFAPEEDAARLPEGRKRGAMKSVHQAIRESVRLQAGKVGELRE